MPLPPAPGAPHRRLRVALIGPVHPFRGGIGHYTALTAQNLARRGHTVLVVSFAGGYPRFLFPGRSDRDPSRVPLAVEAERLISAWSPLSWWRAARRISAWRPALTIVEWWVPFWAPSLGLVARLTGRFTRAPVVFVCHNVLPHDHVNGLVRSLVRFALDGATGYIVHSRTDADLLKGLVPEARDASEAGAGGAGRPIRQTMLAAHDLAPPMPRRVARRQLPLKAGADVALFFGLVRPYKGLRYLLRALPPLVARRPDFRLIVAGEFWEPRAIYERLARELDVASHVLWVDRYLTNEDAAIYFSAADVVVQPYLEASQSGVVATAVTFGRPSIVSRVGGLPEAVEDGVSGLVVPPADEAALSAALLRFFAEPGLKRRLSAGARQAARTRFGWEPVLDALEAFADD